MRRLICVVWFCLAGGIASQAVTVSGRVTSTGPAPVQTYVVALELQQYGILSSVEADAQGFYALDVPGNQRIVLVAIPSSGNVVDGYHVHEFLIPSKALDVTTADVRVDFVTASAHEFVFHGTIDGRMATDGDYPFTIVLDMDETAQQTISLGVSHTPSGVIVPGHNTPVGQRTTFQFEWTLPHAGRIMVRLDNAGLGFDASVPGTTVIEVNQEIARTALVRLDHAIASSSVSTTTAQAVLEDCQAAFDRGEFDPCAGTAIVALENLTFAEARARIPDLRRGTLCVEVRDETGRPVPGATITLSQVDRDFRFGFFDTWANTGAEPMIEARQQGFNFFTCGVYWGESEPQDDQFQWDHLDDDVGIPHLFDLGYRLKGHPLIWLIDLAMPDYLKALDLPDLEPEIEEHIDRIVSRYRGTISTWDVINEAHGTAASGGLTREEVTRITRAAVAQVHSLDPTAATVVNSAFDWYGTSVTSEVYEPDRTVPFSLPIPDYVENLMDHDVRLDVIGQQMYNCGCVSFFVEVGLADTPSGVPTFDLATLDGMLDRLEAFGLPVQLTEHSIPSAMHPDCPQAGYWRVPWSEQNQADYAEAFYTLLFSHPSVEAITWWNLIDIYPFVYHGGLFRADGTPKPVVGRLHQLFSDWTTHETGETNGQGRFTADAFAGTLDIHVTAPDGTDVTQRVHLPERTHRTLTVIVSSAATPIWIPHITASPSWETLLLADAGNTPASFTITQVAQDGSETIAEWTVPAEGQIAVPLSWGGAGWIGPSHSDLRFRVVYRTTEHGATAELELDQALSPDLHLLLPHYAADRLTWCGVALFNPHAQDVTATVNAISPSGQILAETALAISSRTRWVGEIRDLFPERDWRDVARLHVTSEFSLTGIVISGRAHESLLFTRAVSPPQGTEFFLSHIASDRAVWSNTLALDHVGDSDAACTLRFFNGGAVVAEDVRAVPAGQTVVIDLNQTIGSEADFAICEISGSRVFVRQSYTNTTGAMAEFLVPTDAANHHRIDLHQTLTDAPDWNGLALANPTALQRYVVIEAHSPYGHTTARHQIKGHDRWRGTLADLFPNLQAHITHLDIRASGPFTGLRLSGWNDGRLVFVPSRPQLAGRGVGNSKNSVSSFQWH